MDQYQRYEEWKLLSKHGCQFRKIIIKNQWHKCSHSENEYKDERCIDYACPELRIDPIHYFPDKLSDGPYRKRNS